MKKKKKVEGELVPGNKYFWIGLLMLVISIIDLYITYVVFGGDEEEKELFQCMIIFCCICILIFTYYILLPFTTYLKYDEEGITIKRIGRREKHYRYDELGQVLMWTGRGGPSFDLCKKNGRKIFKLTTLYYGLSDFLIMMEEIGLAPGASALIDDEEYNMKGSINIDSMPIYNVGNNSQTSDYWRKEIPVVNGILTDSGKNYLGLFVDNIYNKNAEQMSSDIVLYDILEQKIIRRFSKVNSAFLLFENDFYDLWHYSHGLSDKGAYFFTDAIVDPNDKSDEDITEIDVRIHIYDPSTFAFIDSFCLVDFINANYNKELYCGCWEKELAVLDAIKVNNKDVYIAFGNRFSKYPYFCVLKYDLETKELERVGYKSLRPSSDYGKCQYFDFIFRSIDGSLWAQLKLTDRKSDPTLKELPDFWVTQDYYIDIQNKKILEVNGNSYEFSIDEINDFIDVNEEIYLFNRKKDDMFTARNKDNGRIIIKVDLGKRYSFYSGATPDLKLVVYTHGKEETKKNNNTTSYVLHKCEGNYELVDKIKTNYPCYRINTDCNAFMLEEKTRTIIMQ